MSTTIQSPSNMVVQATTTLPTTLSHLQTRCNNYITTVTGRKNPNLHGIAYRLFRKCKNTRKLRHFAKQADALQADIEHVLATEDNMKQIKTIIASYVTHYSDKESWEEDHDSMEGWEEFMQGLEHPEAEWAEIMLVRRKISLVKQLKALKRDVKIAEMIKVEE